MRRSLSYVLSVILIALLAAGCSQKNEQSTTGSNGKESGSVQRNTETAGNVTNTEIKQDKPVTIKFLHWRSEDKEAFEKVYEKFKLVEPNITIQQEIIPGSEYMNVLKTRLAGGAAPDLFGINGVTEWGRQFTAAGYLEPLNDMAEVNKIQDVFNAASKDESGTQFALVWNSVNFGLFYNKDLFAEAGVQVPTSWAEFLEACQKLKDKGIQPIGAGGKDAYTLYWLVDYIKVNDMLIKDPEGFGKVFKKEVKFSELDSFRSTVEKFDTLVKKGYLSPDVLGMSYNDAITVFSQGKAAMLAGGAFTSPSIRTAKPDMNMGAIPVPGENGENNTFGVAALAFAINKASSDEVKQATKKFLTFLFDEQVSKAYNEEVALFTTIKGLQTSYADSAVTDFSRLPTTLVDQMDPEVVDLSYYDQFTSDLQGMIAGKVTVDQILKNQDAKIK